MDNLYYDIYNYIFSLLDYKDIANLLNCKNRNIYKNAIKYIRNKEIYLQIIMHDLNRFVMYDLEFNLDTKPFILLMQNCSLDVFKYACKNERMNYCYMNMALIGCDIDVLTYLKDNCVQFADNSFYYVNRRPEIVEWLKKNYDKETPY